jgi:hypothetical protein
MPRLPRSIAALTILPILTTIPLQLAVSAERGNTDRPAAAVLGFDMWCQEVQTLSVERCDMHRADDLRAYRQYRDMMERYTTERDTNARRDQQLMDRLRRSPLDTSRDTASGQR